MRQTLDMGTYSDVDVLVEAARHLRQAKDDADARRLREEIGLHDHDVEHQHVADVGDANDERPLITCDAGEVVDADE